MTYNLTKQEFNEMIMMYIREVIHNQKHLLQEINVGSEDYDDQKWLYFIDKLHRKAVGADLMRLKSRDNMKARVSVKHLLDTDNIVIQI